MARIPNIETITLEYQKPNTLGRDSYTRDTTTNPPTGRDRYDSNTIASKVINSIAYQQAYALLSKESDPTWLARLTAIPESVDDANSTWFDDQGWTNNYEDKQDANYQYCMEQISALMQEYQAWKNSLPTTQVQQLSNAGINSAITGQGVSGSSIPNIGVSSNPSSLQSTNPIEVFGSAVGTAVDFILNPVQGFADLALKYKNLNSVQSFNEQSALMSFYQFATENGISVSKDFFSNGWKGVFSGDTWLNNPKIDRTHANETLSKWLAHHKNSPIIAGLASLYPDIMPTINLDGQSLVSTGIASTPVGLTSVVKAQLDLHRNEESYRLKKAKYESDILSHEVGSAEHSAKKAEYDAEYSKYLKRKQEITNTLIETLANSTNEDDILLLSKILLGYNYDEIDILSANADLAEAQGVASIIGNIF